MNKGDLYIPIASTEITRLGNGIFQEELLLEKEYGNYRIIKFMHGPDNIEFRDIFRVSDGPDLWLGCCSKEEFSSSPFDEIPLIYIEPTVRSHLGVYADVTGFYHLENNPIEFFTEFLMEISEKELEQHFNSLSMV